jgi:5'(3')-deoxyribonucleotidase
MIIGVDIDNVLVTTTEAVLEYINERLGTNFVIEDVKEYYIENLLQEQYRWIVPLAFKDSDMWRRVKPIEGAFENIEKLIADGHEIFFCTSTYPENVRKKTKHIARNSNLTMKFVSDRMINIKYKQLLRLDCLIDDCAENLIGNRSYYSICLDYPWNRYIREDSTGAFYRAKDWNDVYNFILNPRASLV